MPHIEKCEVHFYLLADGTCTCVQNAELVECDACGAIVPQEESHLGFECDFCEPCWNEVHMTCKPAATGSGTHDRECPIWVGGICKCSSYVPTPPASQPTVTLDREMYERLVAKLTQAVSPTFQGDNTKHAVRDALALLRAAEQK